MIRGTPENKKDKRDKTMDKKSSFLFHALVCAAATTFLVSACSTGEEEAEPGGSVSVQETEPTTGGDTGVSEEANAGGAVDLGPEGDAAVDCLVRAEVAPESYTVEQLGADMMSPPEEASIDVESPGFSDCLAEAGMEHDSGGDNGSVGG